MNRSIIVFIACIFFFPACQETKEDVSNPVSQKDIQKTIGEEIPFETGMEWIAFHKKRNGQGRSESESAYIVSAEQMNAALQSVGELTGVAFHYGIDETGTTHILVIPVDGSLKVWEGADKIIIDANSDKQIAHSVAATWADNFKLQNPESIWFHFFGKDIFDEMRALPYFESVDIEPATSTLDLTQELLLIVWDNTLTSTGRTQEDDGTVYDASNPCPPCATE